MISLTSDVSIQDLLISKVFESVAFGKSNRSQVALSSSKIKLEFLIDSKEIHGDTTSEIWNDGKYKGMMEHSPCEKKIQMNSENVMQKKTRIMLKDIAEFPVMFLPPLKRSLGQGNIFTIVCHSVHRGACVPHTPQARTSPSGTHTTPPGHACPSPGHTHALLGTHSLWAHTPPPWRILQDVVNERTVRILLECVLFHLIFGKQKYS